MLNPSRVLTSAFKTLGHVFEIVVPSAFSVRAKAKHADLRQENTPVKVADISAQHTNPSQWSHMIKWSTIKLYLIADVQGKH